MLPAPAVLSIVIPTFNERDNLEELVRRIDQSLRGIEWEVIFVDDNSPDGTASAARALYAANPPVRCLRRIGRRGLSSACVEGMLACGAPYIAVMDAELQHDPAVLGKMLATLQGGDVDLAIGSRYTEGGTIGDWDGHRAAMSQFATKLAGLVARQPVLDPMSGFFMLTREALDACVANLSTLGFKILLDIVASSEQPLRIKEIPITFGQRHAGESKLSSNVMFEYVLLLADKLIGKYIPVRFFAFASVGALGVGVHFVMLGAAFKGLGLTFAVSQATATAVAMVFNFSVNNFLTYAGQSLRGLAWFKGLGSFALVCGLGALANVGVASYLYRGEMAWQFAAIAGILVSSVWNYAVTARYTWKAA
jgi:dolichol-phosphate mannosyltransferase